MHAFTSISAIAEYLIKLNRENSIGETWTKAQALFHEILNQTTDAKAIMQLLEADKEDDLPISVKTAMFEKLLELNQRTPALLRMYAAHLWLHGPADDDKVFELRSEADALEQHRS